MPTDQWAKANARAKYGPVHAQKVKRRKARKAGQLKRAAMKRGPGQFSHLSVLWFGKHKGKYIFDVPPGYLGWLCNQPTPKSSNMVRLIEFLRVYLTGVVDVEPYECSRHAPHEMGRRPQTPRPQGTAQRRQR
jgi:uncharacterized protein (DUF3820 family)